MVNGRPLTVLSDNLNDETLLTPNHLLLIRGGPDLSSAGLIRVVSMGGVGDKFSFSLTNFVNDGYASTYPFFSHVRSGCNELSLKQKNQSSHHFRINHSQGGTALNI